MIYTKVKHKYDLWIVVTLYLITVIIRLFKLNDASIYGDEITWMVRGKEVVYAIIHGNFAFFNKGWWLESTITEAIALPLTFFSGLFFVIFSGAGKYSLNLFSDIFASRLPVVLINSLLPVLIYFFISKLFNKKLGLISALIYIVNPISLGLDRWVINDSYLTLFSFTAVVSYIYFATKKKVSLLPGISLALAFLTKPNGILPLVSWIVYEFIEILKKRAFPKYLFLNIFLFLIFVTILWPSSWSQPLVLIFKYLYRQLTLVQEGMSVFYFGQVTNNPGYEYYLFQYLTRMPLVSIFGFFTTLFIKCKKCKLNEFYIISFLSYCLLFLLLITFSNKKLGIRYAQPLLPFFIIFSSHGLINFFNNIKNKLIKYIFAVFAILGIIYPLSYAPDYYLFYNFLIGGPEGAQKYDMVGFCASSRLAAEFLKKERAQGEVCVVACPDPFRYYSNMNLTTDYKNADYTILETYYINQHPEADSVKYFQNKTAWKDLETHGAVIAKIYKKK